MILRQVLLTGGREHADEEVIHPDEGRERRAPGTEKEEDD